LPECWGSARKTQRNTYGGRCAKCKTASPRSRSPIFQVSRRDPCTWGRARVLQDAGAAMRPRRSSGRDCTACVRYLFSKFFHQVSHQGCRGSTWNSTHHSHLSHAAVGNRAPGRLDFAPLSNGVERSIRNAPSRRRPTQRVCFLSASPIIE
jgi:hypothetical protein